MTRSSHGANLPVAWDRSTGGGGKASKHIFMEINDLD
jgi:hypothetical protein